MKVIGGKGRGRYEGDRRQRRGGYEGDRRQRERGI